MKSITIYPQDIIPNAKYMCDAEGRCDLLGQLLMNGYGIRIPPKTRTPQCLSSGINNFVVCVRSYVYCNTPLTLQLLALTPLSPRKQVDEANKLLHPFGIVLVTEQQQETIKSNIQPAKIESKEPELTLTNIFRTSRYSCDCGNSQTLSNLIVDSDNNDILLLCNYCNNELPTNIFNQIKDKFQDSLNLLNPN